MNYRTKSLFIGGAMIILAILAGCTQIKLGYVLAAAGGLIGILIFMREW